MLFRSVSFHTGGAADLRPGAIGQSPCREAALPGIGRRNINNLRYTDDVTLMVETEKLNSLLIRVKEDNERAGLKLNIKKTKVMASGPIASWQIEGERWK